MEVAWTSILIIALLLPGVFFFIGYSSGNRYSREIVKSSAIGEVGWAVAISIAIHLVVWCVLATFGIKFAHITAEVANAQGEPRWKLISQFSPYLFGVALYVLLTALAGLILGWAVSRLAQAGYLPFLVTHKWINQVRQSMKSGLVTTYVMTNTAQNNKVLMYKGVLAEFFQKKEGQFEYVVLRGCSSYFMNFDDAAPQIGKHRDLFSNHPERPKGAWDFLQIEGPNIANILFDPSPEILTSDEGNKALEQALRQIREDLQRLASEGGPVQAAPQSD